MGNQSSLPFDVGKLVSPSEFNRVSGVWQLHDGVHKESGEHVSIFVYKKSDGDANKLALAQNAVRRWKTLRHPYTLQCIEAIEGDNAIYVATKRVRPLCDVIARERQSLAKYPSALVWGLFRLATALQFVNCQASMRHGSVFSSSIFVSEGGDWQLGGFEFASPSSNDAALIQSAAASLWRDADVEGAGVDVRSLLQSGRPPEFESGGWHAAVDSRLPVHAFDSFCLAALARNVYARAGLAVPDALDEVARRLGARRPSERAEASALLRSDYVATRYVEVCRSLEDISIKDASEKDALFVSLASELDQFPPDVCKYKILPHLVAALDYGSANSRVLGPLLKIGVQLTPEEHARFITPSVVRWFSLPDRNMRINLLQNLHHFAPHLDQKLIDKSIYPHVATGFADASETLRELTLRSMLTLVPRMDAQLVNTSVLRALAKLQTDQEPDIRANTTICIGKLAPHFSDTSRAKALLPAFTRALRDPHPRARTAGLMAFIATEQFHAPDTCAKRILPIVAPHAADPDFTVRKHALQALRLFADKLERHSNAVEQARRQRIQAAGGDEAAAAAAEEAANASMLGWAISSLTSKISQYAATSPAESSDASASAGTSATPTSKPTTVQKIRVAIAQPKEQEATRDVKKESVVEREPVQASFDWTGDDDVVDDGNGWGTFEEPSAATPPNAQSKADAASWFDSLDENAAARSSDATSWFGDDDIVGGERATKPSPNDATSWFGADDTATAKKTKKKTQKSVAQSNDSDDNDDWADFDAPAVKNKPTRMERVRERQKRRQRGSKHD
jgi:SCY1-like protein 1